MLWGTYRQSALLCGAIIGTSANFLGIGVSWIVTRLYAIPESLAGAAESPTWKIISISYQTWVHVYLQRVVLLTVYRLNSRFFLKYSGLDFHSAWSPIIFYATTHPLNFKFWFHKFFSLSHITLTNYSLQIQSSHSPLSTHIHLLRVHRCSSDVTRKDKSISAWNVRFKKLTLIDVKNVCRVLFMSDPPRCSSWWGRLHRCCWYIGICKSPPQSVILHRKWQSSLVDLSLLDAIKHCDLQVLWFLDVSHTLCRAISSAICAHLCELCFDVPCWPSSSTRPPLSESCPSCRYVL